MNNFNLNDDFDFSTNISTLKVNMVENNKESKIPDSDLTKPPSNGGKAKKIRKMQSSTLRFRRVKTRAWR